MAVYKDTAFLKILNSESELASFPVEGSFQLMFSNLIDEINIKRNLFIIRQKPNQYPVNISQNKVKHIGDINIDYYDIVDYSWTIGSSLSKPVYILKPSEPLLSNNQYSVIVSENLAPKFYELNKTNSIGPSQAFLNINYDTISTLIDTSPTVYRIVITQTSVLSNGAHNIKYTLYVNNIETATNIDLEVKTGSIILGNNVTLTFNPNVPIIINEEFTITLIGFTRSTITLDQKVITYIDEEVFPIPQEEQNKRVSQEDLLNFYELHGFARRLGEPTSLTPTLNTDEVLGKVEYKTQYPDTFFIKFDTEISESSITPDAFNISITPAFDNFMLPNMNLYNSDNKYIIKYKLIEDDFGKFNTIRFIVSSDIDNLVPSDTNYLLQAE